MKRGKGRKREKTGEKGRERDARFDYFPVDGDDSCPWEFQTPEEHFWWHSAPVARSLAVLDKLGVLDLETGRSDGTPGLMSFSVRIKRTELTPEPGNEEEDGASGIFFVTKRRELHAVAKEALRRAEEQGLIEPFPPRGGWELAGG